MARHYYQIANLYPSLTKPERYSPADKTVTCRSSWETKFVLKFLDKHPDVISWGSESVIIPYYYPVDNKWHRYFMDFEFTSYAADGTIKEYLVEIKPYESTIKPKIPKRQTKGYIERVHTYIKDCSKWDATRKYCAEQRQLGRPIYFEILTEKDWNF
jgi:hypothetical protein